MGEADGVISLRAERWPGETGPMLARPERLVPGVAGVATGAPVVVAVQASDAFESAGTMAYLRSSPGIVPVPAARAGEADVVLVLADQLTDEVAAWMQRSAQRRGNKMAGFVLVSDWLPVPAVMRAVSHAPLSVLPRQGSDYDQVVRAIWSVRERQEPPAAGLGLLPAGKDVAAGPGAAPGGRAAVVLSGRELDVLRLVAEGFDTTEIARRLNYSERTIKNVVQATLSRLEVKNRPHAVAFAIRNDLLLTSPPAGPPSRRRSPLARLMRVRWRASPAMACRDLRGGEKGEKNDAQENP